MKRIRRHVSDRDLQRWLQTGNPSRVENLLDDPDITDRLERLTELDPDTTDALGIAVTPPDGFEERTADVLRERVGDLDRAGTILGLLALGTDTARTLVGDEGLEEPGDDPE